MNESNACSNTELLYISASWMNQNFHLRTDIWTLHLTVTKQECHELDTHSEFHKLGRLLEKRINHSGQRNHGGDDTLIVEISGSQISEMQ
jgi:hypothetical protein